MVRWAERPGLHCGIREGYEAGLGTTVRRAERPGLHCGEDLDEATAAGAARAVELAGQVTALARRALGEEKTDGGP